MWYQINRFHLCAFFTWQLVNLYAGQNIFGIYSNSVPKWSCGNSAPSRNCTIYKSCPKNELRFVDVAFDSAAIEFDWICGSSVLYSSIFTQLQYLGTLFGTALFGYLSDRFGRKPVGIAAMTIAASSTFLSGMAPNVPVLAFLRLVVGLSIGGALVSIGAWVMELLLPQQRMVTRGVFNWGWTRVILTGICFFTREWRLASFVSAGCLLPALISVIFILPESPTWLHCKGLTSKMVDSEIRISRIAGVDYDPVAHKRIHPKTFLESWKTKGLPKKLLTLWTMWFIAAVCGYGNDLSSNRLAGNFYLNQLLFGLLIVIAKLLLLVVDTHCKSFKRRTLHQGSQFLTIVCFAVLLVFMWNNYHGSWFFIVNLFGTALIEYTWDACYLCSTELMETSTRASATGSCSMMARVGSILAPFLSYANTLWPPAVYVTVIALGSVSFLVSYFFLPESKGVDLDDVHVSDEEEHLTSSQNFPLMTSKFKRSDN